VVVRRAIGVIGAGWIVVCGEEPAIVVVGLPSDA
jgi:hypothetical protein